VISYQGEKFTRKQLVFVVEAILAAALDRIEAGMPTSGVTWEERLRHVGGDSDAACECQAYERGAMEAAGMALGVLYAQLTDDGLGIIDALDAANNFDGAVDNWVHDTWFDGGDAVSRRYRRSAGTIRNCYRNYPDCRWHAEGFVTELFDDYLYPEPV
jgi:hypothetical protein